MNEMTEATKATVERTQQLKERIYVLKCILYSINTKDEMIGLDFTERQCSRAIGELVRKSAIIVNDDETMSLLVLGYHCIMMNLDEEYADSYLKYISEQRASNEEMYSVENADLTKNFEILRSYWLFVMGNKKISFEKFLEKLEKGRITKEDILSKRMERKK